MITGGKPLEREDFGLTLARVLEVIPVRTFKDFRFPLLWGLIFTNFGFLPLQILLFLFFAAEKTACKRYVEEGHKLFIETEIV